MMAAAAAAVLCGAAEDVKSDKPLKVLAIGNSFSIEMSSALPPVAAALGRRVDICTMFIGGCSLERHCANIAALETAPYQINWTWDNVNGNPAAPFVSALTNVADEKSGKVRYKSNIPQMLRAEKWDIVTIQQASHESWRPESYHPFGDDLVKEIRAGAPQAKIVVQETWSYVSFCPRYAKWGFDQTEMYNRLHRCYGDFAQKYGFEVIPVGTAVQLYRGALPVKSTDTEVGGDPVGKSPKGDSIHMNADGTYLQALVWAGKLLGEDVTKCAYVAEGVDPAKAVLMRECAARTVAGIEYPELPIRISNETAEEKAKRMAWWTDGRFGMFIHFGLYSVLGRHEWVQNIEAIDPDKYERRYMPRFNPDLYDAKEWAATAKKAGMKYMVLTTKHHEGFCMWDTKTTDFKITNTDFGRDLVREYVDACREAGLGVGFYFSLKDWHSKDFTVDLTHPIMCALKKKGLSGEALRAEVDKINAKRDMDKFRAFMLDQVRELLTQYGKIDIIWYDYTVKSREYGRTYKDWDAVNLVKLTRELQPEIIIDNRLDLMDTDDGWDFVTPEQFKVQTWPTVRGKKVPWETCQTFSGSWGYHRDEETWKSVPQLIELLVHSVSMGGNLILNVGPTARGDFDWRAKDRLSGIGEWMHFNARSIYGCGPAPEGFVAPSGTALTYNPKTNRLYLHLYDYPMGFIPLAFLDKIEYAQFLHDGSEIKLVPSARHHGQSGEQLGALGGMKLPVKKPAIEVPVVEMWLK